MPKGKCSFCHTTATVNARGECAACLQRRKESLIELRRRWETKHAAESTYDDESLEAACELANHFTDVSRWVDEVLSLHAQLVRARREFTGKPRDTAIDRLGGSQGGCREYGVAWRGRAMVLSERS